MAGERRIVQPTFLMPKSLAKYGKQIIAANAYYQDATTEHPAGYLMEGVSVPANINKVASLLQDERAVVITPRDAPWLKSKQAFVVSQVPFELLVNGSSWRRYASIRELVGELNIPNSEPGADLRVAVHKRVMQPLTDSTMLMLGLPLMFSRRNRNVFVSISICLVAGICFSLVTLVCQSLGGLSLLRPTLAAWLPLMIFVPVAVAMSHTFRT